MLLQSDKIIQLIDNGASDEIVLARKHAKKINMHVTGKGVKDYLEMLDSYENTAQKDLREKLVQSNRSLFSFILRPIDKVFTAKGGSVNYNLPQQTINYIKSQINEVSDNLDIKRYLKKVVRLPYIIDANAILFVDLDEKGMLEPHVIFTKQILWYENTGNSVKGIIFEGQKREGKENEGKLFYRVLDSFTDRIFVKDGDDIYELQEETIENYFGYVPAIILGDEKNPNDNIYESVISDIVDDADGFLRRASITNVHELAHLYPRYWSYAQACTRCEGEGQITYEKDGATETMTCPSCGGTGAKTRTNPSDETVIPIPQGDEKVIAPNIAGYVSPDLDTAKFYEELKEGAKNTMFQAMWGTTYEQGGKRETATGRFIDVQPVQDRLKDISYTFQKFHQFLLNAYGRVLLRNLTYNSSVSYGTRYILETADELLDKYMEGSRENISDIVMIDLRNRHLEAEYQNDVVELAKRRKLTKIEPFPTLSVASVVELGISDEDKKNKIYFSQWVGTLTDSNIIFWSEEQLRESLYKYINKKQLENEPTS